MVVVVHSHYNPSHPVARPRLNLGALLVAQTISVLSKQAVRLYLISQLIKRLGPSNIQGCLCQLGQNHNLNNRRKIQMPRGQGDPKRTGISPLIRHLQRGVPRKRKSLPNLNTSYFARLSVGML